EAQLERPLFGPADDADNFTAGKLERPGDPHSQRLRVVCGYCNNNWMGRLQERAKRILLPLVVGDWTDLSAIDQSTLAAWITMTVMVREAANPPTMTSTQTERFAFRQDQSPLDNWSIWIGRNDNLT